MALGPIAPWIGPTDPLRPMQAGASLGLELRGQDIGQSEAADRLKLAYDQLQMEEKQRAREAQNKQELQAATLLLRGQQQQALMQHRQELEQLQGQRQADLNNYRKNALTQQLAINELKTRNIHFAPNGQVLKVNDDGSVDELRPPEEKPKTTREATFSVPLDPNNPLGPKLSGPLSDPEIKKRFDQANANAAPDTGTNASPGFSLLHPSTWFGGSATPAPTGSATNAPPSPYPDGTVVTSKKDGKKYIVRGGVPVPMDGPLAPTMDNYPGPNDNQD